LLRAGSTRTWSRGCI